MIDYRIEVGDAHSHRFVVTVRVARPHVAQKLSLPVWIPGSYMVREFARHLSPIQAWQGQTERKVVPEGKTSWVVHTEGRATLTLQYEVYAFDTSVRAAFLSAQRGFFNGTSVFLMVHGAERTPHRLKITGLPKGWQVATALPAIKTNAMGTGDYEAPDYDTLIDHPVELGTFWRGEFTAKGVRHEFVVSGAPTDFDGQRLLDDTRSICEAQMAFWHGRRQPPFKHYVFMLNVVDEGYGGLEHRQSTALICGRRDLPRQGHKPNKEAYTTLLGLISHEYFHTWNVKRLKPAEFAPYDLSRENHTRLLWFFEGFTSYYDDQFLLRTGLIDANTYLKLVSKTVNQVLSTPGRLTYSLGQASFDAWTRYYRPDENTANATVSYYTKGSLVALALDLSLRQLSNQTDQHQPSLDGVMHRLWLLQRPITLADIAQALADEAGTPPGATSIKPHHGAHKSTPLEAWQWLLEQWTEGVDDLPLQALLEAHGVRWVSKPGSLSQRLGMRIADAAGVQKIQAVMRGSVAETMGLSVSDELLALDNWRIKRADDLTHWHNPTKSQSLLVCRDGQVLSLTLPALVSDKTHAGQLAAASDVVITLLLNEIRSDEQSIALRKAWLQA